MPRKYFPADFSIWKEVSDPPKKDGVYQIITSLALSHYTSKDNGQIPFYEFRYALYIKGEWKLPRKTPIQAIIQTDKQSYLTFAFYRGFSFDPSKFQSNPNKEFQSGSYSEKAYPILSLAN